MRPPCVGEVVTPTAQRREGTASQVGEMNALVTAFAVGNGALSILYAACLGLAAIHPEKRAVHDLLAGSHVVRRTFLGARNSAMSRRCASLRCSWSPRSPRSLAS